ncbi:MAG: hypothetical protein F4X66_09020 [Chloroflexi bacterium]|nr:hypothetical protein [Chloroflexota bacterium]
MGQAEDTPPSRRTTRGFARRTRRNLKLARQSFEIRGDFHVVTQLVNSLLGIVVVPWQCQKQEGEKDFESDIPMDLFKKGWPHWTFTGAEKERESQTLADLVGNLRIAAAHGHYDFSGASDCRLLNKVTIQVGIGPLGNSPWSYEIRGDKLYEFCINLSKFIEASQFESTT